MIQKNQYNYDVFICFTDADENWVEGYLKPYLPDERIITSSNFELGADRVAEYVRAVIESRYTLLILSQAFLNDSDVWEKYGEKLASYARVAQERNCLIPIKLEPCKLPPRLDVTLNSIESIDCTDEARWNEEMTRLRQRLNKPEPAKKEPPPCPYRGMKTFEEEDSKYFFGREKEVKELINYLQKDRFVTVIGPSGSGKSSLVRAGLIPQLTKRQPGQWRIEVVRPGDDDPVDTQAETLEIERHKLEEYDFSQLRWQVLQLLGDQSNYNFFLLVIDQFEKIFTSTASEAELLQKIY